MSLLTPRNGEIRWRESFLKYVGISLIIFLFSFFVRRYFFSGFILGDDAQEVWMLNHILHNGPDFSYSLTVRFSGWLFNFISLKMFGMSEASFFLPTLLISSSLSVIGYYLLLFLGYGVWDAFVAGLFVASAPFEVLIGTVRANDLIMSWCLALGLLCICLFERSPVLQGVLLGFLMWLGFYVKLWVVYLFPAVGLYYLGRVAREREWRGVFFFTVTSGILHGVMGIFWKMKLGGFFPFVTNHAATYPVSADKLGPVLMDYPRMIFVGSEFGTTLFGIIPYLLVGLLVVKWGRKFVQRDPRQAEGLDRWDVYLMVYYVSFFLLINFFPASFKFDQFYSPMRIFRYITPLSFPMALHVAKLVMDVGREVIRKVRWGVYWGTAVWAMLIGINLAQAHEATQPGREYRQSLLAIIEDVRREPPPTLLAEYWLGFILSNVYFNDIQKMSIPIFDELHEVKDYEHWLEEHENTLPEGAFLITGIGSYVHYGAFDEGFRLTLFDHPLDSRWKLFKEYGMQNYLPHPEAARLWKLSR